MEDFFALDDAMDQFKRKYLSKTKNNWGEKYVPFEGCYQLVEVQRSKEELSKLIENDNKLQNLLVESRKMPTSLSP